MNLNQFAAETRLRIFEELKAGKTPSIGEYSEATLKEAHSKGRPQLGSTHYEQNSIFVEYIYPDSQTSSTVLSVKIPSPERIVFMPVPGWVIESIWEGEINGSYQFESEAAALMQEFAGQLTPEKNLALFAPKAPTKRG